MLRFLNRISLSTPRTLPWLQMKRKLSPDSASMMSTLQLDPKERQLKSLLLDVAHHIDKSNAKPDSPDGAVILRWAGGWVRDKILGRPSHDIDVAINCMTGEVFGNKLRDFCDVPENKEKHGLRKEDIGHLHKIEKNPNKSKQLETATVKIFGLDVDFVNLRTETYAEDSRNPQMEFGTAEEDAQRRDATVNALFYNIHTEQIEDFVGGLDDMRAKLIRTPMEPFQTFMDDPLRVLRLVRFASRLSFTIEPTVKEYMSNDSVLQAFRAKISRERVGVEVEKMLKGEHPRNAVRYIDELKLYHTVFTDPANPDMAQPVLTGWDTAYEFLNVFATSPLYNALVLSDEQKYFAWILVCIVPFARIPSADPTANPRKYPPPATLAAREGMKAPNKVADIITGAVRHREEILELRDIVLSGSPRMNERDLFGMAIRKWEAHGTHWRLQILFAILDDVMTRAQKTDAPTPALNDIQDDWKVFVGHIGKLNLEDAPSIKPLVDGRQLSQALGIKPGKWMAPAMDICMEWQLRNPNKTDPAEALEAVRLSKNELGIAHLLK